MFHFIRKNWPVLLAILILWGVTVVLVKSSLKQNLGHFGYPLDDTYIAMSMAKNLALHGVWGVNKYAFESAASTLLWIVLIALSYLLFGVNEYSPFVMNMIAGTVLLFVIAHLLRKLSLSNSVIFIA